MRVFLAGVSCVGKSTVGARLAELLDVPFFDVDIEAEQFYGTSIRRLQDSYTVQAELLIAVSKVLEHMIRREDDFVAALPPFGLMGAMWPVIKDSGSTVILLNDTPKNILKRIIFFDLDSNPINRVLSDEERNYYYEGIKDDIRYFRRSYRRASFEVDISGCDAEGAARRVHTRLLCNQICVKKAS